MAWEYKRVLFSVQETINSNDRLTVKRYNKNGKVVNSEADDSIEDCFNKLGSEGWKLATVTNMDSGVTDSYQPVHDVIEYLFMRKMY